MFTDVTAAAPLARGAERSCLRGRNEARAGAEGGGAHVAGRRRRRAEGRTLRGVGGGGRRGGAPVACHASGEAAAQASGGRPAP